LPIAECVQHSSFVQSLSKENTLMQKQSMASTMIAVSLVLMMAVAANAANLRKFEPDPNRRRYWVPGMVRDGALGRPRNPATWKWEANYETSATCPEGWVNFMTTGNCYKLFTGKTKDPHTPFTNGNVTIMSPATYDAAAAACRNNNPSSYLAVPNTAAENTFLTTDIYNQAKYVSPNQTADPWLASETWLGFDWCGNGAKENSFLGQCADHQTKWGDGWADGSKWGALGVTWRSKSQTINHAFANTAPALSLTRNGAWEFQSKTVKHAFICEMKYARRPLSMKKMGPTVKPFIPPMLKDPLHR